ncbi:unnamed protein product [Owenia fusiformis]|uniref:Uncharacterized protein n=1 Tax=Owenia fusiformis TaxID=6347 RepID=A0A8J1Y5Z6_OWEFU|nr:unnamed protein product [Owenia fusiformis]
MEYRYLSSKPRINTFFYPIIGFILLTIGSIEAGKRNKSTALRRVCYFSTWFQQLSPQDIDPHCCTHIIVAFAGMVDNKITTGQPHDDFLKLEKLYQQVIKLKQQNPKLKVLLAVGGWDYGTAGFTAMLATRNTRKVFIQSAIKYLRGRGFDGIDLDFLYPGARGSPPDDKQRLTMLTKEMKQLFKRDSKKGKKPSLLLVVSVSATKTFIDKGYEVKELSKNCDFLILMTYDMNGVWNKRTAHHASLFSADKTDVKWAAEYWVSKGAIKRKLVIGLPTYGRTYTLIGGHTLGSPISGPGRPGSITNETGFISYPEVCELLRQDGQRFWIDDQKVPYATLGNQWVGYDDPQSVTEKSLWLKTNGFGGASIWTLNMDDVNGTCTGTKMPLTNAVKHILECKKNKCDITPPVPTGAPTRQPVGGISLASSSLSRLPACPCSNIGNLLFADPCDCSMYYHCSYGNPYHKPCDGGLRWRDEKKWCDFDSIANCTINEAVCNNIVADRRPKCFKPSPSLPEEKSAHYSKLGPGAPACPCYNTGKLLFGDPCDCSMYYHCAHGVPYHKQCNNGLQWREEKMWCDYDFLANCTVSENAMCSDKSTNGTKDCIKR